MATRGETGGLGMGDEVGREVELKEDGVFVKDWDVMGDDDIAENVDERDEIDDDEYEDFRVDNVSDIKLEEVAEMIVDDANGGDSVNEDRDERADKRLEDISNTELEEVTKRSLLGDDKNVVEDVFELEPEGEMINAPDVDLRVERGELSVAAVEFEDPAIDPFDTELRVGKVVNMLEDNGVVLVGGPENEVDRSELTELLLKDIMLELIMDELLNERDEEIT